MREDLQIVCIPSRDRAFAADAVRLADTIPPELDPLDARVWFEATLRRAHPHALVREQAGSGGAGPDVRLWYVTARDHPFRIDASVRVPLPPAEAFGVYVERVTEWQSAVDLERIDTSPGLVGREYGAAYHVLGLRYTGHFRTVAALPPLEVAFEAEGSGITVWYVTRFTATDDGTAVQVRGDYALPTSLLTRMADLLGLEHMIARDIDRAHDSYRRLCELVVHDLADRSGRSLEEPLTWADAVDHLRSAQVRYRAAIDETDDPGGLAQAQEELLEARGEVEQLKRDLLLPMEGDAPDG